MVVGTGDGTGVGNLEGSCEGGLVNSGDGNADG